MSKLTKYLDESPEICEGQAQSAGEYKIPIKVQKLEESKCLIKPGY